MYIEVKCNTCNKRFHKDFTVEELNMVKCPHCGAEISSYEAECLRYLSETYFSAINRLQNISLCGIHEESKNIVISTDIDSLNQVYNVAPPEVRTRMTSLFDKFYLLMYHDAKSGNLSGLDSTIEKIRRVWEEKINRKREEAGELLGFGAEDESLRR